MRSPLSLERSSLYVFLEYGRPKNKKGTSEEMPFPLLHDNLFKPQGQRHHNWT